MTCLFIVVLLLTTRLLYKAFSAKPLNDPFNGIPEEDDVDDEGTKRAPGPRTHTTPPASSQVLPNWMSPAPLGAAAAAHQPDVSEEERQAMEREMRDAKKSRGGELQV